MPTNLLIITKEENCEIKALQQSLLVFSRGGEIKRKVVNEEQAIEPSEFLKYDFIILYEMKREYILNLYRELFLNLYWVGKLICIESNGKDPLFGESSEIDFFNKPIDLPNLLNSTNNDGIPAQVCKPIVYIFDDYTPFVKPDGSFIYSEKDNNRFVKIFSKDEKIPVYDDILKNFIADILSLSIDYSPIFPPIWIKNDRANILKQIIDNLPLEEIENNRFKIAAFIVDLEWLPNLSIINEPSEGKSVIMNQSDNNWLEMGHKAISYLIRRFPEIPCYVYSGDTKKERLLESMSYGARWIFLKLISHHGETINGNKIKERISRANLQEHLKNFIPVEYGSFSGLPFPEQLIFDNNSLPWKQLVKNLEISLPIGSCVNGLQLQNIISRLFPAAKEVRPVKVMNNGKSKAQATFFVSTSTEDEFKATQFIKVGNWFEILKEYLAYKNIISLRLNAYATSVIDKPVMVDDTREGKFTGMPHGGLLYEIAGIPEGYEKLKSFGELITEYIHKPKGGDYLVRCLSQTFSHVLIPLYRKNDDVIVSDTDNRPLWKWMPAVLPPLFTGRIVDKKNLETDLMSLGSHELQGFKNNTSWILTSNDLRSVFNSIKNEDLYLLLENFILLEVDWEENQSGMGEMTIQHPDLGFRVRLTREGQYFSNHFNEPWIRLGFPVTVDAELDKDNKEKKKYEISIIKSYLSVSEITDNKNDNVLIINSILDKLINETGCNFINPFDIFFSDNKLPFYYCINAHKGVIHGDLNPNNILFSDKEKIGWLIDFEHAEKDGMIAFDLAKLETEIINHYLIPELVKFATSLDNDTTVSVKKCLIFALQSIDCLDTAHFTTITGSNKSDIDSDLYIPVVNLLQIIIEIRKFVFNALELTNEEYKWALSTYSFIALKFTYQESLAPLLSFLISGYYLNSLIPEYAVENIVKRLTYGEKTKTIANEIDQMLIQYTRNDSKEKLKKLTEDMSRPSADQSYVDWGDSPPERWDLASTGCVANMTPIFGYLWLMVKAEKSKDEGGNYKIVVPKISSRGGSCGTVDILESGGLSFPSNPETIVDQCRQNGGVLCKQDAKLTPVDKAFMKRRKATNLMKNFKLTYASIISKKIAMGIDNVIIDVKVGKDTKIFPSGKTENVSFDAFTNTEEKGLLIENEQLHKTFNNLLSTVGEEPDIKQTNAKKYNYCYNKEEFSRGDTDNIKMNIRWFFTNADMPQGRAIGRKLILAYIEGIFNDEDNMIKKVVTRKNINYTKLYLSFLPEICDIEFATDDNCWQLIKDQWSKLSEQLNSRDYPKYNAIKKYKSKDENSQRVYTKDKKYLYDLNRITFKIEPYQTIGDRNKIETMNAYYLDSLFDWLCGKDTFDKEVGIWLHKLPGETINKNESLITVFYRPSRCEKNEVRRKTRNFIFEHIVLT